MPPLLVQLPATVIVNAVPAAKVPAVSVTLPLMSRVLVLATTVRVLPPPLFTVKWWNVWVVLVPPKVCAPPPLKFTVLVLGVNVPLLLQLPATLIVVALLPARVVVLSICTPARVALPILNVPA